MKSTQFKQYLNQNKGILYGTVCVECDKDVTTKSMEGVLHVWYCENVRHPDDYTDNEDELPRCQHVVCGTCSLPNHKRERKQISKKGWNGVPS